MWWASKTTPNDEQINYSSSDKNVSMVVIRMEFDDYPLLDDDTAWSNKIFGYNFSQANNYFYEVSNGKFRLVKAKENYGIQNDGVITVSMNKNHPGNSNIRDVLDDAIF